MPTTKPESTLSGKRGEYLPHWTYDKSTYHICFRLNDSMPGAVLESYKTERATILDNAQRHGRELTDNEVIQLQRLFSSKVDEYLDKGSGNCYMKDEEIAEIVASTLNFFDNTRYYLHAWVVMPNHVHVIVEPFAGFELFKIIHSWKSFSANKINKLLGLQGKLWHSDAYNHIIRSQKAYDYLMEYVRSNPERAGLKGWKFKYKREQD